MDKLKSFICFSCCFRATDADPLAHEFRPHQSSSSSSSTWTRSNPNESPEMKEKCWGFMSRAGKHRRHQPGNFKYDPLSYALNFDEGPDFDNDDGVSAAENRYRSFSSRLPPSPPVSTVAAVVAKEVVCR